MYLSSIHLQNWRSYRDAHFTFEAPSARRPLVLIGAMNGHGKTSLLLSLYLGLFGRFGLRHAEGFAHFKDEDLPWYREAIRRFRRDSAPSDEPTGIDLVFSPTAHEIEQGMCEVRLVRKWFFASDGKPRQGDGFEDVQLYIDSRPVNVSALDDAIPRIERHLFPAEFMPAFLFDGEQAQRLIENAGENGIKKALEVLFGTKILEDVDKSIKDYINRTKSKAGSTRTFTVQQQLVEEKRKQRQKLDDHLSDLKKQLDEVQTRRNEFEREKATLDERLVRLGGASRANVEEIHKQYADADREVANAEDALTKHAQGLGLTLAVSRLAPAIVNRLRAEELREQWEGLRQGTIARTEQVLQVAMPEPAHADELLGHLHPDLRKRVRDRFARALEQIYHPPPEGCASEYLLGHVKGEMRQRLLDLVDRVHHTDSRGIQNAAKRVKEAREKKQDVEVQRARIADLPREAQQIAEALKKITDEISGCIHQIGGLEKEIKSTRADLQRLDVELVQLEDTLAKLEPDQRRIAVADRVRRTLDALVDELRPITVRRMRDLVTGHFTCFADRQFRDAAVEFPDGGNPILRRPGHSDRVIETMSGFERRSFGIAFSMALAEMTDRRLPLVIDTPLGNADTRYRPRLLKALASAEFLDQIIILTHDAEVTGDLLEAIRPQVRQTFLVEFDPQRRESVITANAFFGNGARA